MAEIKVAPLAAPKQLLLNFSVSYNDIALKDAIRGVNTIIKEAVRFGADQDATKKMLEVLAEQNSIVLDALDAIHEKLEG